MASLDQTINDPFLTSAYGKQERKYCGGKLSRGWCVALSTLVCLIIVGVLIIIGIFVVGRNIAQAQINGSDLQFTMRITEFKDTSFKAECITKLDNRGTEAATIEPATGTLQFGGTSFAEVPLPHIDAAGAATTTITIVDWITITDQATFDAFGAALLKSPSVDIHLSASINVHAIGITYRGLSLSKTITLTGFNGFKNAVTVLSQTVTGGLDERLELQLQVQLYNNASVAFPSLDVLNFTVTSHGDTPVVLGWAVTNGPATINFGVNQLSHTAYLIRTQANAAIFARLLSGFVQGATLQLELKGSDDTTGIKILKTTFSQFSTSTTLVGFTHREDKLFEAVYYGVSTGTIFTSNDPYNCSFTELHRFDDAFVWVHNPMNATFTLESAAFNIIWEGDPAAPAPMLYAQTKASRLGFTIPPYGTRVLKQRLCITDNNDDLGRILQFILQLLPIEGVAQGLTPFQMRIAVNGNIVGSLGDFKNLVFSYQQPAISVCSRINPVT